MGPIITKQCPECENSPNYHEDSDCDYDETPPEEWSKGSIGFRPHRCSTPLRLTVSYSRNRLLTNLGTFSQRFSRLLTDSG